MATLTKETKTISEYLDNEYAAYGMYTIENRAIPSVVDGFKPTQRKIITACHRIWKNSDKPIKVFQLGGRVAADISYHHGDCLDIDTKILLVDGSYLCIREWIENFPNESFELLSFDESKKQWVTGIGHSPRIGNTTIDQFEIELESGEIIKCTGNHPFFTSNRGWIKAEELNEEDDILTP